MSNVQFISTEQSRRIGIFSEMLLAVRDETDARSAHQAVVTRLKKAYGPLGYIEVSIEGLGPSEYRITRIWHDDASEGVPDHSPWKAEGVPIRRGGVVAEILSQGKPCLIADMQIAPEDEAQELRRYRSAQASPGGLGNLGNWTLIMSTSPNAFNLDSLEGLVMRMGLISGTLQNLETLAKLRRANAFIDSEMDRIAAIQRALLPQEAPQVPGLEVAASSQTFARVGGDLYDFALVPGDRWAFLIADASGHGPAAAVVAAMVNAIVHSYPGRPDATNTSGPAGVMAFANRQLAQKHIEDSFVTAFIGFWHPPTRSFTYARAGHNPPLLLSPDGAIKPLNAVGTIPLAIEPDTTFEQTSQPLQRGDTVVMYTDGIVEAVNHRGEQFGEESLRQVLRDLAGASAADTLASIRQALSRHIGGTPPSDDQTLLVLRAT